MPDKNTQKPQKVMQKTNSSPPPPPVPPEGQGNSDGRFRRADEVFCEFCGLIMKMNSSICPHCGHKTKKSKKTPGCAIAAIAIGVVMVGMCIIGILAAIAIPNFIAYRTKAVEAAIQTELKNVQIAQEEYFLYNNKYALNFESLGYESDIITSHNIIITVEQADSSCYKLKGTSDRTSKIFWIGCEDTAPEYEENPY